MTCEERENKAKDLCKGVMSALLIAGIVICAAGYLRAEEHKPPAMPPAVVVVSDVGMGMIAPESEFIGTVYYREVSEVASEVGGLVEAVNCEEGQRVRKGNSLVKLNAELLEKSLDAAQADYEQVLSDLDKAQRELKRAGGLRQSELISDQAYDDRKFAVSGLEKKALSLKSGVERLTVELGKKTVRAPFDGVVIKKRVDRGEWISVGATVATMANDSAVDIITDVPEPVTGHITAGMLVKVMAGGRELTGTVRTLIPRGDIASRTFPVKIQAANTASLIEGMEARALLPTGPQEQSFTVNRDALISTSAMTVVFTVNDEVARMIPVEVVGYRGMIAGIRGDGLKEGMQVVIKGNERLRDGQAVVIQK